MKKLLKDLYNHKILNKDEAKDALISLTNGSQNSIIFTPLLPRAGPR
jgi:hypothetical protein